MTYVLIDPILQTVPGFLKSGFVFGFVAFVIFLKIQRFLFSFFFIIAWGWTWEIILFLIAYYLNMYHKAKIAE